ncbi:MAG TPA: transglutaminase-like domain-containing protein [Patescibacteria group bacterium]|nr:transglutaminase-like domain-containing protein [Patescibacteria group bacterium]
MRKVFSFFIFILLAFLALVFPSFASAKEFSSFYKTTYRFANSAEAFVTQEVSLVNLTADYYVSEYSLSILGSQIDSIEAFDNVGPVKTQTQVKDETTIITLYFNEKVVGKGKMLSFILKYRCGGLAKKEGNLWQISIPKLAKDDEIDEYELSLRIPLEFGKVAFANPTPRREEIVDRFYQLQFEKDDLVNYGVWVTVGQYQTFDFVINYELTNSSATSRVEKIALPPDTNYQTLYYESLEPEPIDLEIDPDGNWLAVYRLGANEKLAIKAKGKANLFFQSKKGHWPEPEFNANDYLTASKNWPADQSLIKDLAGSLKTPAAIYRYVVNNLNYDYQSIKKGMERKGALGALNNPQKSICTDFTDLFVALCRAAGIPARELAGYAYSDNPRLKELAAKNDLLHSWAEYYDQQKQEWIMVDPTWEQTSGGLDFFNKFDMAHFVFVIHGRSDTLPLSPGAYKDNESSEKQVFVELSSEEVIKNPKAFSITSVRPQLLFSLKNNSLEVEMKNESGFSLNNEIFRLEGEPKVEPNEWFFKQIPPFSRFRIAFNLKPMEQIRDYQLKFTLKTGEEARELTLTVNSLILRAGIISGVLLTVALVLLLWSLKKNRCSPLEENANLKEE